MSLLEQLGDAERPMTLSDLSRACGIPKPTAYRYLAELEKMGYVFRDPQSSAFALGTMVLSLARRFSGHSDTLNAARQLLPQVARETGETAHLGILRVPDVVFIDLAESPQRVRAFISRGERLPAHCVAAGKAILAASEPDVVDSVIRHGLKRFTPDTQSDVETFLSALASCRETGYATAIGEWMPEVVGISGPLVSPTGTVVGALGISCPRSRTDAARVQTLGKMVRRYCEQVSQALGLAK